MVTKGIESLSSSQKNAVQGIEKGQQLADEAVYLIDTFLALTNETTAASRDLALQLNTNFCPTVRAELCSNLTEYLDSPYVAAAAAQAGTNVQTLEDICNFNDIPYADQVEKLINARIQELIPAELLQTRQDIVEVSDMLAHVRSNAGE